MLTETLDAPLLCRQVHAYLKTRVGWGGQLIAARCSDAASSGAPSLRRARVLRVIRYRRPLPGGDTARGCPGYTRDFETRAATHVIKASVLEAHAGTPEVDTRAHFPIQSIDSFSEFAYVDMRNDVERQHRARAFRVTVARRRRRNGTPVERAGPANAALTPGD